MNHCIFPEIILTQNNMQMLKNVKLRSEVESILFEKKAREYWKTYRKRNSQRIDKVKSYRQSNYRWLPDL